MKKKKDFIKRIYPHLMPLKTYQISKIGATSEGISIITLWEDQEKVPGWLRQQQNRQDKFQKECTVETLTLQNYPSPFHLQLQAQHHWSWQTEDRSSIWLHISDWYNHHSESCFPGQWTELKQMVSLVIFCSITCCGSNYYPYDSHYKTVTTIPR